MAQLVFGAIGAVVGFYFGGPTGAEIGWMAGAAIGGLAFPQKPPGPHINDLRIQDSAYGKSIPRVYGMYRIAGNVIWAGQPHEDTSSGKGMGKGGNGQTVVRMSFAIGLCEGPIAGVRRIWANGKLVYDVSNPSNFAAISGSSQMLQNFVVHNGDEVQWPDPTIESQLGAGNVPAHRGLAYVVFNELDLSPWGNYLPSFSFEIVAGLNEIYVQGTVGTYTQTPSQDTGTLSGLSAQGAIYMGSGYGGSGNYSGIWVGQITASGAQLWNPYGTTANFLPADPIGWVATPTACWSDYPGLFAPGSSGWNWYDPSGAIFHGPPTGIPSGAAGSGRSFVKIGNNIWCSCNYGGNSYPIVGLTLGIANNASGAGSIFVTSTVQKPFTVLGVTSTYVYASDGAGNLYQFDGVSLVQTNMWSGLDSGSLQYVQCGHAVDDRHVYMYGGGKLYVFDATTGALTVLGSGFSASPQTMQVLGPGLVMLGAAGGAGGTLYYIALTFQSAGTFGIPLSNIVADICGRASLATTQYDVSQLTDNVAGYAITSNTTARDNLSPLMSAYFFDATNADGKLTFVKRGGASVGTFAYGDLGASTAVGDTANETPLQIVRAQELDLPQKMTLTYVGLNNDYQQNAQVAFRSSTKSNKEASLSVAVCLSDDEGLQKAQSMLWNAWLSREQFTFTTTLAYLNYVPNDVVTLQGAGGASYTVRLVDCQFDAQGALKWTALSEAPAIYTSTAAGGPPAGFPAQQLPYNGPTQLAVLDVLPLRTQDTSPGLYLAASGYAASWPGCTVEMSRDGTSFTDLISIADASVMGATQSALGNFGGGNQPDELNTVTVHVEEGTLASVTYANFLAGNNAAWIGGEIVFFRNATLIAANTYRLSGFLRGVGGTEWVTSTHAVGEAFVLLGNALAPVGVNVHDIGTQLSFETRLMNVFAGTPGPVLKLTPTNARQQPLAPAKFRAQPGSAASLADISLFWTRRARINAQWLNGADVPLDEQVESYQLTISNSGGTPVRTVTVTAAQTYIYSAANITADGFSSGNTINFSVAQNSDLGILGRATAASMTR
ncbi:phage tail protein [Ralstonia sp.]|uniref:phage tail protein n=1 Tax=Ralstonia sp. TaxID=54061 RepID=UPI00397CFCA5